MNEPRSVYLALKHRKYKINAYSNRFFVKAQHLRELYYDVSLSVSTFREALANVEKHYTKYPPNLPYR